MKSKIYLCSFASPDLAKARSNFIKNAKALNIYDNIKVFGVNDLSISLKKRIKSRITKFDLRGYGYWCWKPYIIKKFSKSLPKNAIIQYMDVGTEINLNGKKNLKNYLKMVNKENFLTFKYKPSLKIKSNLFKIQVYREYQFTKSDIFKKFKLNLNSSISKDFQILSGIFFFKNNKKSYKIIHEWEKEMRNENLIDDTPSKSLNHQDFISNRHDQSFFSIICKLNKVKSLSCSDELEFVLKNNKIFWKHLKDKPFLLKRNKSRSFLNKILRLISKVFY